MKFPWCANPGGALPTLSRVEWHPLTDANKAINANHSVPSLGCLVYSVVCLVLVCLLGALLLYWLS